MDFGRTVVDPEWADIAVNPLHDSIAGDADRTENLDAAIDHAIQRFGTEHLGHAGLVARFVALVEKPGSMPDRQARHMQIDFIVSEHESDALMFADRLSERMAAPRVFGSNGMTTTRRA